MRPRLHRRILNTLPPPPFLPLFLPIYPRTVFPQRNSRRKARSRNSRRRMAATAINPPLQTHPLRMPQCRLTHGGMMPLQTLRILLSVLPPVLFLPPYLPTLPRTGPHQRTARRLPLLRTPQLPTHAETTLLLSPKIPSNYRLSLLPLCLPLCLRTHQRMARRLNSRLSMLRTILSHLHLPRNLQPQLTRAEMTAPTPKIPSKCQPSLLPLCLPLCLLTSHRRTARRLNSRLSMLRTVFLHLPRNLRPQLTRAEMTAP